MRSSKTRLLALLLACCAFAGPAFADHNAYHPGQLHPDPDHRAYCQTKYKACQRGCKTSEGEHHCTKCRINYKHCVTH